MPKGVNRINSGDIWLAFVFCDVCIIAENIVPVLYPEKSPNNMPIPGMNIRRQIRRLFVKIPR